MLYHPLDSQMRVPAVMGSVPVTSETLMQRHQLILPAIILNPSSGFEELPHGFHDLLLSSPIVSEVWPSGTARAFEVA
jgi:hypothetical protein